MRHQMEDRIVSPAKPLRSVDGAQQPLYKRPSQSSRRSFTSVGARRVNCVEPLPNLAVVEAKPKKGAEASDNVL
ncbi:hypothetical protein BEL01nite_86680 [Bradyrhizobium elkanii]|nr:hypothetical protein BEL01nite_86680 [Bradyrhizobium elkanii]